MDTTPSRLELLPRELREIIYFYLGFPVGMYCVHHCDVPCTALIAFRKLTLSEMIITITANALVDIYEKPPSCGPRLEKFMETAHIVKISSAGKPEDKGKQQLRLSGIDENGHKHADCRIPKCELMFADRFFYEDLSACLAAVETLKG